MRRDGKLGRGWGCSSGEKQRGSLAKCGPTVEKWCPSGGGDTAVLESRSSPSVYVRGI